MEYQITAHWTAFSGEFPNREVAGTGSIEFTMTGDVCNLAGARDIAAKNVAEKEGYSYRDVTATIDAIIIRPSVSETLCKPVAKVAPESVWIWAENAAIGSAIVFAMLLISIAVVSLLKNICVWRLIANAGAKNTNKEGR